MQPCTEKETLKRIENKLDKIDNKLDNHLERIAKAEVWINGHTTVLAFVVTALLSVLSLIVGK
jgi:hypothetical protein